IGLMNGTVTGNTSVGGLAGDNRGLIYQAYVDNYVILGGTNGNIMGGLAGQNSGNISNSHAISFVLGQQGIPDHGVLIGGLVGNNIDSNTGGSISGSFDTGRVTGSNFVGGLAGFNSGDIRQSYATGSVSGSAYVGGLVGENKPILSGFVPMFTSIEETYSTGLVEGVFDVGELVGSNSSNINKNYWDKQSSGQSTSAGGTGLNTEQMKHSASYLGWSWNTCSSYGFCSGLWQIKEGVSYPTFKVSISTPGIVLTPTDPVVVPTPVRPVEVPTPVRPPVEVPAQAAAYDDPASPISSATRSSTDQTSSGSINLVNEEFTLANNTLNLTREQIASVTNYTAQYGQNNFLSTTNANTASKDIVINYENNQQAQVGYIDNAIENTVLANTKTSKEYTCSTLQSMTDKFYQDAKDKYFKSGSSIFAEFANMEDKDILVNTVTNLNQAVEKNQANVDLVLDKIPSDFILNDLNIKSYLSSRIKRSLLAKFYNETLWLSDELENVYNQQPDSVKTLLDNAVEPFNNLERIAAANANNKEYGTKSNSAALADSFKNSTYQLLDVLKATPAIASFEIKLLPGTKVYREAYKNLRSYSEYSFKPQEAKSILDMTSEIPSIAVNITTLMSGIKNGEQDKISEAFVGIYDSLEKIAKVDKTGSLFKDSKTVEALDIVNNILSMLKDIKEAKSSFESYKTMKFLDTTLIGNQAMLQDMLLGNAMDKTLNSVVSLTKLISKFDTTGKVNDLATNVSDFLDIYEIAGNDIQRREAQILKDTQIENEKKYEQMKIAAINRSAGIKKYAEVLNYSYNLYSGGKDTKITITDGI
ncbi:MAG: hypothetical protein ACOYMG_02875, partial [Candidatus Methylumidiphilus sp.]